MFLASLDTDRQTTSVENTRLNDMYNVYEHEVNPRFNFSIFIIWEDGLMSRPSTWFTSMHQPMYDTSCPKSQVKSTCVTAKFRSFFDHAETDEKRQNVISSSILRPISFIFAVHVSFIISLQLI